MAIRTPTLREFQSLDIMKLEARGPGVYEQELLTEGNSLLSSVYVYTTSGGSVTVEYFDTTTGTDLGEAYPLQAHTPQSTPNTTNRITVTSIHNKPFVRPTVTGGTITFGLFITVVASFASDLDAALKLHAAFVNLARDKGVPTMVYDPVAGQWFFQTGAGGVSDVNVTNSLTANIDTDILQVNKTIVGQTAAAIPSVTNTTVTYTVPVGMKFNWLSGVGTADADCLFTIEVDAVEVMKHRNHHVKPDCTLSPAPLGMTLDAGQVLTVKTKNRSVWGTLSLIDVFIYGNEYTP